MSTKSTIVHGDGFHLYTDWLDEIADSKVIHLRLDGVSFEAQADRESTSVTVTIPLDMARQLGLPVGAADDEEGKPDG